MNLAIVNLITRTSLCRNKVPEVRSNKDAMIVKCAEQMREQGLDAELYISDVYKPAGDEHLSVPVNYLPTLLQKVFLPTRLPFTPSLAQKLKDRYDVVICSEAFQWSTVLAVLAKLTSSKKNLKIIVWHELSRHQKMFGGLPSKIFHKVILRYILDPFIAAYVPRSAVAARFLEKQGIPKTKITYPVAHGYDHHVFFHNPQVKKERYLFSPSRLVASKGVDVLLKAFSLVCRKIDNINLIIQGEGPLLDELQHACAELGIEHRVTFDTNRLGHDQMRERYQKAMLTVITSREDYVIFSEMESIACGTPVVLSSGIDSHINYLDDKGGFSFENGDYRELADILIRTLMDPASLRRLETQALQKSFSNTNAHISKQFIKIFKRIQSA